MVAPTPETPRGVLDGRAKKWLERFLWFRAALGLAELAMRHAPQAVEKVAANPVIEAITRLAAWALHAIKGLTS